MKFLEIVDKMGKLPEEATTPINPRTFSVMYKYMFNKQMNTSFELFVCASL